MNIIELLNSDINRRNIENEMLNIVRNMRDINCDEDAVREMTITIKFMKDVYGDVHAGVKVKSRLQPRQSNTQTMMNLSRAEAEVLKPVILYGREEEDDAQECEKVSGE